MHNNSALQIFAICVASCCAFILIPIALYYFKQFYDLRHHIIIAKRHWKIIASQMVCTVLFLLIERPLAILFMNGIIDETNSIYFIDRLLYVISLHIDLYLIVLRFWMIHYDINFNNAQNTAYWHGLIQKDDKEASELSSHHTNFYLNHHSTFGNLSYLKRILIIIVLCTMSISYCSFLISYDLYERPFCDTIFFLVDGLILFIPSISAIIIIWSKTPSFQDIFGIKHEMRIIAYLTILGFIFYIVWVTLTSITFVKSQWIPNINVFISCLLYFSVNIFPVIWLFHFSKQSVPLFHKNNNNSRDRIRTSSSPSDTKLSLSTILSSQTGFESFIAHLTKEFSAENLVSVVEMLQFRNYYISKTEQEIEEMEKDYNRKYKPMKVKCSFIGGELDINKIKNHIKSRKGTDNMIPTITEKADENGLNNVGTTRLNRSNTDRMKELMSAMGNNNLHSAAMSIAKSQKLKDPGYKGIVLPLNIPQSSIVFNNQYCIKHKIILLCNKYITNDAELQLNISSSCKNDIMEKKNKIIQLDLDECKNIFNEVLKEIYCLMNGSLTRFKLTQEYMLFIEEMELVQSSEPHIE